MAKKKKLNKNLIVGLGIFGFALTTVAGVLMVHTLRKTDPTEFEEKANSYLQRGDYKRASVYFGQAFQATLRADDPQPEFLVRAADMKYEMGEELKALADYQNAVVMDPTLLAAQERVLDLRVEIAELGGSAPNWGNVKETAEAILALDNQAEHVRALHGLGKAYVGLREQSPENDELGGEYLTKAVEAEPESVEYAYELSRYHAGRKALGKARNVLKRNVAMNSKPGKDAADARCHYAAILADAGDFERAEELLKEAARMAGDDPAAQAAVNVATGRYWRLRWRDLRIAAATDPASEAEAEAVSKRTVEAFQAAIDAAPEEFDAYMYLSEFYRMTYRFDEGIEVLKKRLELPFVRTGLQAFRTRANRFQLLLGLSELYVILAESEPPGTKTRDDFAATANMYVDDALSEFPTGMQAFFMQGRIAYALGQYRDAVKAFEHAETQARGINWLNLQFLALARLELGQLGAARDAITQAIANQNASAGCWIIYARIMLQMDDPESAVTAADQALSKNPNAQEARLYKAEALRLLGRSAAASETLAKIGISAPVMTAVQARLLAEQGSVSEALDMLAAGLADNPSEISLVRAAASIYQAEDRASEGRVVVAKALADNPDDFDLQMIDLQLQDLPEEERMKQYRALVDTIKDEYSRTIRMIALAEQTEDIEGELEHIQKAKGMITGRTTPAARQAGQRALQTLIDRQFSRAQKIGDTAMLDAIVKETAELNLDSAEGLSYQGRRIMVDGFDLLNEARAAARAGNEEETNRYRDLATGKFEEAIESLKQALEQFPSSGQTHAELGQAYWSLNRPDEARIAFERANDLTPRNGAVLKRLAAIALQQGNQAQFQSWLELCRQVTPDDPWVLEQSLVIQEETDPRQGIVRRSKMRDERPDDLINLEKLALLYNRVGDFDKSAECADAILAAMPEGDNNWTGRSAALYREIGRNSKALEVLERHVRELPYEQQAEAQLLVGEHFYALGDISRADAAYLAAADIDENMRICAELGRYFLSSRRVKFALKWLEKAHEKAAAEQSVAVSPIKLMWLEALIRTDQLEEAKKLCDAYLIDNPDAAAGLYMDAQIDVAAGRIVEAIDKLTLLLEKYPDHPQAALARAQNLASVGEWQEAIRDLEALRTRQPDALKYAPRIMLADAYARDGRDDAAFRELEGIYAEDSDAVEVIEKLVDMNVKRRLYPEADSLLTALLNRDPENVRWLMLSGDVAVRQKDRTKALANLKKAAKLSGFNTELTVRVLSACQKDKLDAVEQGINYFRSTIPPNKRRPGVQLTYAVLLAQRGDQSDALDAFYVALRQKGMNSFDFMSRIAALARLTFGMQGAIEAFNQKPSEELFLRSNRQILATLYRINGDIPQAEAINDDLLATVEDPRERNLLLLRKALILEARNDLAGAEQSYLEIIKADPDNLEALNNLAYMLADKCDRPADGIPHAKLAAEISGQPAVIDTLGWAYLRNGQAREAVAQLTKARKKDPSFIPSTFHLGEAYRQLGQFEEAESLLSEVTGINAGGLFDEYREQAIASLTKVENRSTD